MTWLKALTLVALSLGAWRKYKEMGKPIVRGGKRWWRQPDGRYARWHGIGLRRAEDLPLEQVCDLPQGRETLVGKEQRLCSHFSGSRLKAELECSLLNS